MTDQIRKAPRAPNRRQFDLNKIAAYAVVIASTGVVTTASQFFSLPAQVETLTKLQEQSNASTTLLTQQVAELVAIQRQNGGRIDKIDSELGKVIRVVDRHSDDIANIKSEIKK